VLLIVSSSTRYARRYARVLFVCVEDSVCVCVWATLFRTRFSVLCFNFSDKFLRYPTSVSRRKPLSDGVCSKHTHCTNVIPRYRHSIAVYRASLAVYSAPMASHYPSVCRRLSPQRGPRAASAAAAVFTLVIHVFRRAPPPPPPPDVICCGYLSVFGSSQHSVRYIPTVAAELELELRPTISCTNSLLPLTDCSAVQLLEIRRVLTSCFRPVSMPAVRRQYLQRRAMRDFDMMVLAHATMSVSVCL